MSQSEIDVIKLNVWIIGDWIIEFLLYLILLNISNPCNGTSGKCAAELLFITEHITYHSNIW